MKRITREWTLAKASERSGLLMLGAYAHAKATDPHWGWSDAWILMGLVSLAMASHPPDPIKAACLAYKVTLGCLTLLTRRGDLRNEKEEEKE